MLRRLQSLFVRPSSEGEELHFHRGPQGLAAPCFDSNCDMPHLEVAGDLA